ncbi:hypothetical protein FHW36_10667 [Chitinophaga polysaccharea]|uniref:Uncharacterized protein n=1 Tax=Chitinophaga polysaccharea TaxID=1293035 RepID=A0A561PL56_9BACT|nr:hypothetical protein [Chitinophaga polysaccharea]TWF38844.1 hypothetical protein FHW36_10667 [Chitinophaga polysaccharea]
MTAHEFLSHHGELKDVNVHFVKAGNTIVKPLVGLLEEYLSAQGITTGRQVVKTASPAKRRLANTKNS